MTVHQFIDALYRGLLGREPEGGAVADWIRRLGSGQSLKEMVRAFIECDEFKRRRDGDVRLFVPPGHFYSPIVNPASLEPRFDALCSDREIAGIDISPERHLQVWEELAPFLQRLPFTDGPDRGFRYHFDNPFYAIGDGSVYSALLQRHLPKRVIEIGSGYSSACLLDTVELFFTHPVEIHFIEPFPDRLRSLLSDRPYRAATIHTVDVQQVPVSLFRSLEAGDMLFIDSTHVMKTGSDVCYELFDILPALAPGVLVHFHDIFWPFEYPRSWAIDSNRSWNEIYALRAFLMYNRSFEVHFFGDFFARRFRDRIQRDYPALLRNPGGNFWIRKRTPA